MPQAKTSELIPIPVKNIGEAVQALNDGLALALLSTHDAVQRFQLQVKHADSVAKLLTTEALIAATRGEQPKAEFVERSNLPLYTRGKIPKQIT